MITAGDRLHDLSSISIAVERGFALKIVEVSCTFAEGQLDVETNELFFWATTVHCIHYTKSVRSERYMVNQYLAFGEVFAVEMTEYEEYVEYNLKYGDDYYEYK